MFLKQACPCGLVSPIVNKSFGVTQPNDSPATVASFLNHDLLSEELLCNPCKNLKCKIEATLYDWKISKFTNVQDSKRKA